MLLCPTVVVPPQRTLSTGKNAAVGGKDFVSLQFLVYTFRPERASFSILSPGHSCQIPLGRAPANRPRVPRVVCAERRLLALQGWCRCTVGAPVFDFLWVRSVATTTKRPVYFRGWKVELLQGRMSVPWDTRCTDHGPFRALSGDELKKVGHELEGSPSHCTRECAMYIGSSIQQ